MKYEETYVRLNWPYLNEIGISRPRNAEVLINPDACIFIKENISCPFILSMITFMTCYQEVNAFSAKNIYNHFFDDDRGNMFVFEMAFERMFEANIIVEVE